MFHRSPKASVDLIMLYNRFQADSTKFMQELPKQNPKVRMELFKEMGRHKKWIAENQLLAAKIFQSVEFSDFGVKENPGSTRRTNTYKFCWKRGVFRFLEKDCSNTLKVSFKKNQLEIDKRILIVMSDLLLNELQKGDLKLIFKNGKVDFDNIKVSKKAIDFVVGYLQYKSNKSINSLSTKTVIDALKISNALLIKSLYSKLLDFLFSKITIDDPDLKRIIKFASECRMIRLKNKCLTCLENSQVTSIVSDLSALTNYDHDTTHLILSKCRNPSSKSEEMTADQFLKKINTWKLLSLSVSKWKSIPGKCLAEMLKGANLLKVFRAHRCDRNFNADLLEIVKAIQENCKDVELLDLSKLTKRKIKQASEIFKVIGEMDSLKGDRRDGFLKRVEFARFEI